jgi:hypothetical protein
MVQYCAKGGLVEAPKPRWFLFDKVQKWKRVLREEKKICCVGKKKKKKGWEAQASGRCDIQDTTRVR